VTVFARRRLVQTLATDEDNRWQAARELSAIKDKRALRRVERLLEGDGDEEARAAAAYVLGFNAASDAADLLAARLRDPDESAMVRAYAAEGLGHLLQGEPVVAGIRSTIVSCLRDPEPEVRFWCGFAAGVLDLQEARPQLEQLTADEAGIEGWWTVGEEASWALRCLDGEEGPPLPERR
jgi:HEAT repeat protein